MDVVFECDVFSSYYTVVKIALSPCVTVFKCTKSMYVCVCGCVSVCKMMQ